VPVDWSVGPTRFSQSLVSYCVYELRLSEDEAFRRAQASKFARKFPIVFERVAAGEIHLTGLLLLGPHLTEENHVELFERAKHRTKREIARLVRMVDPLPSVPSVIEPLGPGPVGIAAANSSTWAKMAEALAMPVRELEPGDRPKDWTDPDAHRGLDEPITGGPPDELHARVPDARVLDTHGGVAHGDHAPSERRSLGLQRYKVQFTATQEYVDLLEEAQDFLAHAVRDRSLEEVHLRAMRALVDQLKTRKYARTNTRAKSQPMEAPSPSTEGVGETPCRDADAHSPAARACARQAPRRRGRYIPAAVRRAVWERDGGRCTYVDATGQRCRERACLEFDHIDPYARGGPPAVSNLRLACRSHNGLAAEQVFGRDFIERKKG